MRQQFNGHVEKGVSREPLTGIEVYEKSKNFKTIFGKMHREKPKKGKIKDGDNVLRDMKEAKIRPKLWPEDEATKKAFLPHACYILSREEKRIFCECLKGIKVPTGYSSNIRRFVSTTDKKVVGMKSHDCHVIDPKTLDDMEYDIVETLCKFEMHFPPSFFDIMTHLVMHFPREIKECGPVFMRWMYPYERQMGTLADKAKNRANPEGSIVKGFISEKAGKYCSVFLAKVKEIGIPTSRHEGRLQGKGKVGRKLVKPPLDRYKKAHRFVLQNLSAVHPYIEKHLHELKIHNPRISSYALMQEHNRHYVDVQQNSGVVVVASSTEYSSSRDTRPVEAIQAYYGVIQEIWELDYVDFTSPLFRCTWADNRRGMKTNELFGFTLVDSSHYTDGEEPFVLASQSKQVFYIKDNIDPQWHVVVEGEDIVDDVEYDRDEGLVVPITTTKRHTTMEENIDDHDGQEQSGDMDASTSQWESAYGKQIVNCAQRVNIKVKGYPKYDKVQKQNLWEKSKVIKI
ncbi:uncharacterized protein LOC110729270 [Chenopodium quinoa]|uniref:uncharacterized protein LOC110729270 n=1 Tax=Chenopodium quinoa TaxID=63459 RepID=UPI000B790187|nr:uncharacterized protein LOC110729270 [Chenopodium quinoa]